MGNISQESILLLRDIIENEKDNQYWKNRFKGLPAKEDLMLRGCFKELKENGLIDVKWADNLPYILVVLRDGYLCYEKFELPILETKFDKEIKELLERTKDIKSPINAAPISVNINEYNRPSEDWINDFEIFYNRYLKEHSLGERIKNILFHRKLNAYNELVSCLTSISKDEEFVSMIRGENKMDVIKNGEKKKYDVFISHANKDKLDIIEGLYDSLLQLGINIFYDKKSLEWGDKWKDRILEGVEKSEFAIIVISENFFDREWTEKELNEFLNRQNKNGQKIILPVVHKISMSQLKEKYSLIADIQAIDSSDYTYDQIALLFAGQLIKRLKA